MLQTKVDFQFEYLEIQATTCVEHRTFDFYSVFF